MAGRYTAVPDGQCYELLKSQWLLSSRSVQPKSEGVVSLLSGRRLGGRRAHRRTAMFDASSGLHNTRKLFGSLCFSRLSVASQQEPVIRRGGLLAGSRAVLGVART